MLAGGISNGPSGRRGKLGSKGSAKIWPRDKERFGLYSRPFTKIQDFLWLGMVDDAQESGSQMLLRCCIG